MRYNRRTKRLQKGLEVNDACRLVRADKKIGFDTSENAAYTKRTTDVCMYPFTLSQPLSQSQRRYVIYDTFYCIFPPPEDGTRPTSQDDILRAYGTWLAKAKTEHALPPEMLEAIKRKNKALTHEESAAVLNHFFVSNKFVCGGYMISSTDGGENTAITLIYHRTQPVLRDGGILVDPNIFCLLESVRDITTHSHIINEWCGTIAKEVSMAQWGVDTNISGIPLDKTLYGTVTCALKTTFFSQPDHII